MFRSYLRLILFAAGLLIGVQIPNLVEQYTERVHAHWIEATRQFAGFQKTADLYFKGDVVALIQHHRGSTDAVFRDEARVIEANYQRLRMLEGEWEALKVPFVRRLLHIATEPQSELLQETISAYSYNVPLNPAAMTSGIILGFSVAFGVEGLALLVLALMQRVFVPKRRPAARPDALKTQPVSTASSRRH